MFEIFSKELKDAFTLPLPGKAGQMALKPYLKINKNLEPPQLLNPKPSAVMSLIYPKQNIPHILFIERPVYTGVHSGQIAFPGGKKESYDATFLAAALRETKEEIGVSNDKIQVVGELSEIYVLASNFIVRPFVGILQDIPTLSLEKSEVANVLEVPLYRFFEQGIIKEKPMKNNLGFTLMAPYYDLDGKVLWGATAMMVSELCSIIASQKINLSNR